MDRQVLRLTAPVCVASHLGMRFPWGLRHCLTSPQMFHWTFVCDYSPWFSSLDALRYFSPWIKKVSRDFEFVNYLKDLSEIHPIHINTSFYL